MRCAGSRRRSIASVHGGVRLRVRDGDDRDRAPPCGNHTTGPPHRLCRRRRIAIGIPLDVLRPNFVRTAMSWWGARPHTPSPSSSLALARPACLVRFAPSSRLSRPLHIDPAHGERDQGAEHDEPGDVRNPVPVAAQAPTRVGLQQRIVPSVSMRMPVAPTIAAASPKPTKCPNPFRGSIVSCFRRRSAGPAAPSPPVGRSSADLIRDYSRPWHRIATRTANNAQAIGRQWRPGYCMCKRVRRNILLAQQLDQPRQARTRSGAVSNSC